MNAPTDDAHVHELERWIYRLQCNCMWCWNPEPPRTVECATCDYEVRETGMSAADFEALWDRAVWP